MPKETKRINADWRTALEKLDKFIREKPESSRGSRSLTEGLDPRARELVSGVLRHRSRLESFWQGFVKKQPKGRLRTLLLLALWDVVRGDREQPLAQVVDHAVAQIALHCSPREKNFANAILRKTAPLARKAWNCEDLPPPSEWPVFFSHPPELIRRWQNAFGLEATEQLLRWNNTPGENYVRWRDPKTLPPEACRETPWKDFYKLSSTAWPEIREALHAGKAYIQDPATRGLRECLNDFSGTRFFDACAAPGGKILLAADSLRLSRREDMHFVAMDKKGARFRKLRENLSNASLAEKIDLLAGDLRTDLRPQLQAAQLPTAFDAVLLDVPCSNTGVFRRRPEARWHWSEEAFSLLTRQQEQFLENGATAVASGGLLIYSTCSIEEEENQAVVSRFLDSAGGEKFALETSRVFYPWIDGHDGAGLFALRRISK